MPYDTPSAYLRAQLREHMLSRITGLKLTRAQAAEAMGFNKSQMSRFMAGEDLFSLDRLADAAAALGLNLRLSATRPWERR
jgi:predicted XRE-type DNA-binding protein